MVRICSILKTGRLLHIYFFIDEAIQESTLNIHLKYAYAKRIRIASRCATGAKVSP
jgi:hypothetical protein